VTAPRFVDCKCGHSKDHHEMPALAPQCVAGGCNCLSYRPATAPEKSKPPAATVSPIRPVPSAPSEEPEVNDEQPAAIDDLVHDGKRSSSQRTVKLAEKVAALVDELTGRLAGEREEAAAAKEREAATAAARAEIAELEAKLAEAKALLRGTPKAKPTPTAKQTGEYPCPDCPKVLTTPQGLGAHRAKAHGYRRETA
jgi:hypothetical protein